jgi:alkylation response protein AidB-like acyl-CoA dehydrogenase
MSELDEFRREIEVWFRENRPPVPEFLLPESFMEVGSDAQFEYLRDWQRKIYEAGYLGMAWPRDYGGGGRPQVYQDIVNAEMARQKVPFVPNTIGLNWAGPLILAMGTEEAKKRYIKGILNAEDIWCQGFSEPDQGSDLANCAALKVIRDSALLFASAEAAGGIAGVLEVIVEYLNTRSAFGRKIGSYQSLKHSCADILVGLERTRSHVYHAASLLAAGEDAEVALRMAKVEAGDSFVFAGDRAIQFHGGFGFTYDCDAQLYLRRALWLQYAFGDAAHHRRRLADLLLPSG